MHAICMRNGRTRVSGFWGNPGFCVLSFLLGSQVANASRRCPLLIDLLSARQFAGIVQGLKTHYEDAR